MGTTYVDPPKPLPLTRYDRLTDKDEPTRKNPDVEVTDHCQCCGIYQDAIDLPEHIKNWLPGGGDPLIRVEVKMQLGEDSFRLGSLLLCPWCAQALRGHFVDPFIEKYHQPLQEKLDRIRGVLDDPE